MPYDLLMVLQGLTAIAASSQHRGSITMGGGWQSQPARVESLAKFIGARPTKVL